MGTSDTFRPISSTKMCPVCGEKFLANLTHCQYDHNELVDISKDPLLGQRLSERYLIMEFINHGGWGAVYKAKDLTMERAVAIKVLHPHLATDANQLKRFQREIQTSSSLNHANICTVFDCGAFNDTRPYLVMEYLQGECLDAILARDYRISVRRCVRIFSQVCSALAAAHRFQLVHRDIKPSNIMILGDDQVKVLDFGLAKYIAGRTERLTSTGEIFGTLQYMSPEQLKGENVDARSDIYSLGCVLYEALSGKKVCDSEIPYECIIKHVQQVPVPLETSCPDIYIPTQMRLTVSKSLEKNARDRFQTAEEFESALKASATGTSDLGRSGNKKVVVAAGATLLALATAAAVTVGWQKWGPGSSHTVVASHPVGVIAANVPKLAAPSSSKPADVARKTPPIAVSGAQPAGTVSGASPIAESNNVQSTPKLESKAGEPKTAALTPKIETPHLLAPIRTTTRTSEQQPAMTASGFVAKSHVINPAHSKVTEPVSKTHSRSVASKATRSPQDSVSATLTANPQKQSLAMVPNVPTGGTVGANCHGSWSMGKLGVAFSDPNSDDSEAVIVTALKQGNYKNLAVLNLTFTSGASDSLMMWLSQNCPHLKLLNITGTHVTAAGLAYLGSLREFSELRFFHAGFGNGSVATIASLPHLKVLRLGGPALSDAGLATLPSTRIHLLALGSSEFTSNALNIVATMPNLADLQLTKCRVSSGAIAGLSRVNNLKALKLEGRNFNDQIMINGVAYLTRLQRLYLESSSVGLAGLQAVSRLPNLQILNMADNNVSADQAVDLLLTFPRLKEVFVSSVSGDTRAKLERAGIKVSISTGTVVGE